MAVEIQVMAPSRPMVPMTSGLASTRFSKTGSVTDWPPRRAVTSVKPLTTAPMVGSSSRFTCTISNHR